jgi:hypothetical protein
MGPSLEGHERDDHRDDPVLNASRRSRPLLNLPRFAVHPLDLLIGG